MPTYEYKCDACGHSFDVFQSMNDEPETICPECGGPIQRVINGGAGLIFKGSGFYITDYRSESYKKAEKADKPAAAPAKTKSEKSPA